MFFVLLSEGLGLVTDTVNLIAHDWKNVSQSRVGSDSGDKDGKIIKKY